MSEIKLIVTDLDGTLVLPRADEPTPRVHEALETVQKRGVIVAAATARPYEMAAKLFSHIGLEGPAIFDGGASIRNIKTGELLWQNWLEIERVKQIAKLVLPYSKIVDVSPNYNAQDAQDVVADDIAEAAPYVWCLIEANALTQLQPEFAKIGNLAIHPGHGWPDYPGYLDTQITDIGSTKRHAVEALQAMLGITVKQTMALGDASNDMPLFQAAGIKVAMGNAIPELKVLADYVAPSVEEDGWADAIERYVLN